VTGETNAQLIKRLRTEAELRGDCYECRARPAKGMSGGVYVKRCQLCLDRSKERDNARKRRPGHCAGCGKRWRSRRFRYCVQCRANTQRRIRRKQAAHIAAGLCAHCSSPIGFTASGQRSKRFCQHHLEVNRTKTVARVLRRRARELGLIPEPDPPLPCDGK
jgi:hypothetical protein